MHEIKMEKKQAALSGVFPAFSGLPDLYPILYIRTEMALDLTDVDIFRFDEEQRLLIVDEKISAVEMSLVQEFERIRESTSHFKASILIMETGMTDCPENIEVEGWPPYTNGIVFWARAAIKIPDTKVESFHHDYEPKKFKNEELASLFNLERKRFTDSTYFGANPTGVGATTDGFILNEAGDAFDRKLNRHYSSEEVQAMARSHK